MAVTRLAVDVPAAAPPNPLLSLEADELSESDITIPISQNRTDADCKHSMRHVKNVAGAKALVQKTCTTDWRKTPTYLDQKEAAPCNQLMCLTQS